MATPKSPKKHSVIHPDEGLCCSFFKMIEYVVS